MEKTNLNNVKFLLEAITYFDIYKSEEAYLDIPKDYIFKFAYYYIKGTEGYKAITESDFKALKISAIRAILSKIALGEMPSTVPGNIEELVDEAEKHSEETKKEISQKKYNKEAALIWKSQFTDKATQIIPQETAKGTASSARKTEVADIPGGVRISAGTGASLISSAPILLPRAVISLGAQYTEKPTEVKEEWMKYNGISSTIVEQIKVKAIENGVILSKAQEKSVKELVSSLRVYEQSFPAIYQAATEARSEIKLSMSEVNLLLSPDPKDSKDFLSSRVASPLGKGPLGLIAVGFLNSLVENDKPKSPESYSEFSKNLTKASRAAAESGLKDFAFQTQKFVTSPNFSDARRDLSITTVLGGMALIVGGYAAVGVPVAITGVGGFFINSLNGVASFTSYISAVFTAIIQIIVNTTIKTAVAVAFSTLAAIALCLFIITNNAYVVPPGSNQPGINSSMISSVTPSQCPVNGGRMNDGSYHPGDETRGHGSNDYWRRMGGEACRWPLPQTASSCFGPSNSGNVCSNQKNTCPYYGFAMDIFPTGDTNVYMPMVEGKVVQWKYNGVHFLNGPKGEEGESWGFTDTTGRYSIVFTHITGMLVSETKTYSSGDLVDQMYPQVTANGTSNTHLHIEFQVDGIYQQPENYFACDGSVSPVNQSSPAPNNSSPSGEPATTSV